MYSKRDVDSAASAVLAFTKSKEAPYEVERAVLLITAAWYEERRCLYEAGIVPADEIGDEVKDANA